LCLLIVMPGFFFGTLLAMLLITLRR